ncbi:MULTISPECIES: polysaccharide biosynthesis/export family protein [Sphingobium]|uniref:polysaccharide biosynthesis/export family protein n=1 Tax=Sphingobium TaxID=165695 RepID=UPI00183251A6|nr:MULTISPECIES: polysaccharide biosynthesis/export family protein [Sphingobium]MCW2361391.1 polysaccharide export outer membrane protein [Sphingobium sp. B10D3B]MCW2401930.1 polysaccharide export outer membrane protein [Sphingobium sp. B10D7B]MCW2408909.1 polysaccharide export outer membrane protein [Sphingobium xanthum]
MVEGKVQIVDVNDAVTGHLVNAYRAPAFAQVFGDTPIPGTLIGRGDALEITIWEAPPAVLFGTSTLGTPGIPSAAVASITSRQNGLPLQVVDAAGLIDVPFAGRVMAADRAPQDVAHDIRSRLAKKAHDPQVVVRIANNAAANVTVVGDVVASTRMPLTPKGERLLDALASAGGVRQPVGKMTIQITRGGLVEGMPLETVIKDPLQNVRLKSDDIVTLLFQPYSFTVLGAARANSEVPFEGTGLSLSQALGRMGGLDDQRANPRGVFIFRFEKARAFPLAAGKPLPGVTSDGKVPVIYRVDMRDPKTLFVAQSFPIRDKDVIYVSNAPLADFSKFLQAVSQIVFPIAVIQNANIF